MVAKRFSSTTDKKDVRERERERKKQTRTAKKNAGCEKSRRGK